MLTDTFLREGSPYRGLPQISGRAAEQPATPSHNSPLVVSADSHFSLTEDLWVDRVPAAFRDRVPRIWFDERNGLYHIGFDGKSMYPDSLLPILQQMESLPGAYDLAQRLRDLDTEGVAKEILFPNILQAFFHLPDLALREWIFRGYNRYLADLQGREPGRLYPVAIPNFWDPAAAAASVMEIAELGLKTLMLPNTPGKKADGTNIIFSNPEYDPMWAAIVEADLPVCFHIGESANQEGPNGFGATFMWNLGPNYFRKSFGELVFGKVLDRHPGLKVVFAEAGINWVPGTLQDAELCFDQHALTFETRPDIRPSDYWHRNCFATFMWDPAGLAMIDLIGSERIMWSVDYPHPESTFGRTRTALDEIYATVGPDRGAAIVGGNAVKLFGLA